MIPDPDDFPILPYYDARPAVMQQRWPFTGPAHPDDAGYDLRSADPPWIIEPMGLQIFDTGLHFGIVPGYAGFLRERSNFGGRRVIARLAKLEYDEMHNLVAILAGLIDAPYRGRVGVALFNLSDKPLPVDTGDRIAQMVIQRVYTPPPMQFSSAEELGETSRGQFGWGSTGLQ